MKIAVINNYIMIDSLYLLIDLFVRNIFIEHVHCADHHLGTKDAAMNRRAWSLPSCSIESSGETQLASPSLHMWWVTIRGKKNIFTLNENGYYYQAS